MNIVVIAVAVMLSLAALGTIYRIAKGPSLLDRVIAADVLLAIFGAGLATEMALNVAPGAGGFVASSVTVARFVAHKREEG